MWLSVSDTDQWFDRSSKRQFANRRRCLCFMKVTISFYTTVLSSVSKYIDNKQDRWIVSTVLYDVSLDQRLHQRAEMHGQSEHSVLISEFDVRDRAFRVLFPMLTWTFLHYPFSTLTLARDVRCQIQQGDSCPETFTQTIPINHFRPEPRFSPYMLKEEENSYR